MAHGVASSSVMRIVARVRWDERSSVLLQFARFGAVLPSRGLGPRLIPAQMKGLSSSAIGQMADADISDPATSTWCARLPHWHPW
jgi:hypothetical protein